MQHKLRISTWEYATVKAHSTEVSKEAARNGSTDVTSRCVTYTVYTVSTKGPKLVNSDTRARLMESKERFSLSSCQTWPRPEGMVRACCVGHVLSVRCCASWRDV